MPTPALSNIDFKEQIFQNQDRFYFINAAGVKRQYRISTGITTDALGVGQPGQAQIYSIQNLDRFDNAIQNQIQPLQWLEDATFPLIGNYEVKGNMIYFEDEVTEIEFTLQHDFSNSPHITSELFSCLNSTKMKVLKSTKLSKLLRLAMSLQIPHMEETTPLRITSGLEVWWMLKWNSILGHLNQQASGILTQKCGIV